MAKRGKGEAGADDAPGGTGKGRLLPAVVIAVGLIGGGYFMGGKGGSCAAGAPDPPTATPTPKYNSNGPQGEVKPKNIENAERG
jgi:hypothetical protein